MAGRGVYWFGVPRGRAIAAAVVRRAQMRAAFQHLARDPDVGLARIVARGLKAAARILRNAAGLGRIGFVPVRPPVRGPFPDIADHVVKAVAVWRKGLYRRGPFIAVRTKILDREVALPGVRHLSAIRRERVAPGELCAVEAAA